MTNEVTTMLSREEFETLALQQLDGLYGAAFHLCKNEADAKDLVQDTYMRALRFRQKFQAGTNFRGWMFKILYNLFVNQYHRKNWEREHITPVEPGDLGQTSHETNPETNALLKLDLELLNQALQEVPETYRTPVVLCDVNEFSYDEIAAILECPIGTVMSRLYRGRKLLRQKLIAMEKQSSKSSTTIDINQYRQQRGATNGL